MDTSPRTPTRLSLPTADELDEDTYSEEMKKGFKGHFCMGWKQSESNTCGAPAKVKVQVLHGAMANEWLYACGTHKHICLGLASRASNSAGVEPIEFNNERTELTDLELDNILDELCVYIKQPKEQLELEVDKKATVINFKVKLLPAARRVSQMEEDKAKLAAEKELLSVRNAKLEEQLRLAQEQLAIRDIGDEAAASASAATTPMSAKEKKAAKAAGKAKAEQ